MDGHTGLYNVRARWYDPFLGRFLSEDPIGIEGGINTYAYAFNDPVNLSDPTGLAPWSCDLNEMTNQCGTGAILPGITVYATGRGPNAGFSPFLFNSRGMSIMGRYATGDEPSLFDRIEDWSRCVERETIGNVQAYEAAVDGAFADIAGAAGGALQTATSMFAKGELGSRALRGAGLETTKTPKILGRWALGRSWSFAQPALVQGISIGGRHVTHFALRAAIGTNLLAGLAVHGAWRGGIMLGSGLVGLWNCAQ